MLFWNRFVALRSGDWSFSLGVALLQGKLPYRDYFCAAPPLHFMKSALILKIFGQKLIVLRGFAVFERTVLALILYSWLARFFRAGPAALAAIVAIIVSAGDMADPLSSYNHDAILWTIAAGFSASFALDPGRRRIIVPLAALSGICASLALCTKQTIGLGAVAGIPIACAALLWRIGGARRAAVFLAGFVAGCAIPIAILFASLAKMGLAGEFVRQAFVRGPAAKNMGGFQFPLRVIRAAIRYWPATILGLAAVPLLWKAVRRSGVGPGNNPANPLRELLSILLVSGASVAAGAILAYRGVALLPLLTKAAIYFVFIACPSLGIYYAYLVLRNSISQRQAQHCLLAAVSFIVAFMLSMSWPAFEAMVIPGLGFLVAAAIEGTNSSGRRIGFALAALLMLTQTCVKLNTPSGFSDFVEQSVPEATMSSSLPEMSGFRLPPGMLSLIEGTTRIVRENSTPSDTIFTYPGLGLFYTLTGRSWPTLSGDENIDVVSDSTAIEEAQRLLERRPKVIIYYRQPEDYLELEELWWRRGRPSGQRDIIAAIESLIRNYQLAGAFDNPVGDRKILVYVRP
jgi:hypothetical protein